MLLFVIALQAVQPSPATSVLTTARSAVNHLDDTTAVIAAGYRPLLTFRLLDRTPFQGEHWFMPSRSDTSGTVRLGEPAFVMFGLVNGRIRRVGVAYATRIPPEAPPPQGLGGDLTAVWHSHYFCRGVPGEGPLAIFTNAGDCRAHGGVPLPRKTVMIHVWTDSPNPEGIYGHDNPNLPFLAVGITPPGPLEWHDPARVRALRTLAMAIAETYDSRFPIARKLEWANTNPALADSLSVHRSAIARRIPALRHAAAADNRAAYDRVAALMVAEWTALNALYGRMASTPALRADLRSMHEEALTRAHH